MSEQLENKVLEPVVEDIPDVGNTYYMPHHCVKRKDKSTIRLRVVYDGSSSACGPLLNQMLYEGQSLMPQLVLMKFSCRKIAVTVDCEKV